MKRLFLLVIFYFGLLPYLKEGALQLAGPAHGYAQAMDVILANYLNQNNTNPNYTYRVAPTAQSCNCSVVKIDQSSGQIVEIIHGGPQYVEAHPDFKAYLENPSNYNNLPPPPTPTQYESIYTENYIDHLEDILRMEQRMEDFSNWARDFWQSMGNAMEANPDQPEECDGSLGSWGGALQENVMPYNNSGNSGPLNCTNSFLLPNKSIIHFTPAQQARIKRLHFDGSTLIAVEDHSGMVYTNPYDVEVGQYSYKCSPDWNMQYGGEFIKEVYTTYKFVAFDRLRTALANGSVPNLYYDQNLKYWAGIPETNLDYCILVENTNIELVAPGKVVMGLNSAGQLYCETLTEEDALLTTSSKRNEKFKLRELHLDHYVNIPKWVQDFLHKIQLYPDQCTLDYVNQHLDQLHQSQAYTSEQDENTKKLMEMESMGYSILFGTLYCKTNEASAAGKSPSTQFGLGLLNEAIASVDIRQIVDGLSNIAKGLGNLVQANVKNVIDATEDAILEQMILGSMDYELLAKRIIEANNAQLSTIYNKVVTIANNFEQTYFTKCDADPTYGDICSYRHGQVTMMVLPIILTGGDWAVVKANALSAKYATNTNRAIQLMDAATASNKQILQESYTLLDDVGASTTASKTVIKESNGTVTASIKQEGNAGAEAIVITEAADLVNKTKLSALSTEIPTSSGNLSKAKFDNHANTHVIDKDVDPNLKAAADDIIANGDPAGTNTEALVQNYLFQNKMNLTPLDGKYGSNNGFDGLFIEGTIANPTKIYITECKQWGPGVSLSPADLNTGLHAQMSDAWIRQVADHIRDAGRTNIADMIQANPGLIEKYVVTVNKSSKSINILKLGNF